ncbi:MAG: cryptochrome/photolyase family protein [Chthoniobacterales bacterium]
MGFTHTLFWFRQDLRISDNPGLFEAAKNGPVIPIYILDDHSAGVFKMGAASRWWLHQSLEKLNHALDGKLHLDVGDPIEIITKLIHTHNVEAVCWNRCYEPWRIKVDAALKTKLQEMGISCKSFNGSLLWEPWEALKSDQTPYKVFTPFYRHASSSPPRKPLPKPPEITLLYDKENHLYLQDLKLLPEVPWYHDFEKEWEVGEVGAHKKLCAFLTQGLSGYKEGRNHPGQRNVSHLSPHLHFGEISPQQVWDAASNVGPEIPKKDQDHFLSELGWREFSYSLLYHFPELPWKNFQAKFDRFPWKENHVLLKKWQQGKTGYPIVDAGMRELWQTGTMHNRVRMIVASFLVKNLLIHWHHGEAWFWDTLLDADLANNSASWQWVAGSGADAAPYFRIFNPVLQGEKFDPEGTYTRRFVPELRAIPKKFLFKPWEAPLEVLKAAGVDLGKTYPKPIVDLATSRDKALEAYHQL